MEAASSTVVSAHARHSDAFTVAREVARLALRQLPRGTPPGWLLTFAGGQHDPDALLRGFRSELGDLPIVGGCGAGVITPEETGTTGYECGALLFPAALTPVRILSVHDLEHGETAAGRRLGEALRALDLPHSATVLLFYDSIRSSPPPVLHVGSQLLDGLYEGLADCQPLVLGGGTLSDVELSAGYVFDGQQVARHAAVALVMPTGLSAQVTIMHGCLPASRFLEITRIDGDRVLELDGRPALRVVEDYLGVPRAELLERHPLPDLTLGEKHGDPYAPFNDEQYVNRLVIGLDPSDESLILFEADFQVGSRVQLMSYDPWHMIESVRDQSRNLLERLTPRTLLFGLYVDCAGRSMAFNGLDEDETAPIREQMAGRAPWLGFYSGVEIAPFHGRSRPLDWTGVLALFTLEA